MAADGRRVTDMGNSAATRSLVPRATHAGPAPLPITTSLKSHSVGPKFFEFSYGHPQGGQETGGGLLPLGQVRARADKDQGRGNTPREQNHRKPRVA